MELLVRLAIRLDPWLGGSRRDHLPWQWRVEPQPTVRQRLLQVPAVLRGRFLVMLNLQPWPMAAIDAVGTAVTYVRTGFYFASSLPWLPFERYVRREAEIIQRAAAAGC